MMDMDCIFINEKTNNINNNNKNKYENTWHVMKNITVIV